MKQCFISVVIPTRERGEVLEKSLKTVTAQNYDNLEILVSDNCSCDRTREIVEEVRDPRIKYVNTGRRLSMSENWEFALTHVKGEWVSIIGDDDGLLPESLNRVADIIAETGVQAIRSSVCSYRWPSLTGKPYGRLSIPLASGFEERHSSAWLTRLLCADAGYPELPMLYNGGFVSMSVLHNIKARTGAFYRACIPDIYSAVAIALLVDRYVYVYEPLAINGASRHSTGTSHFSAISSAPGAIFRAEKNLPFHADMPLCADGSYPKSHLALIYESYLQAGELHPPVTNELHGRQLELILATAGAHQSAVDQWGRLFARQHGLDFDSIKGNAMRGSIIRNVETAFRRAATYANTYAVGSEALPIRDIYEASIAAAAVRRANPSRFRNLVRIAGRVFDRR
jgi:glycosyltransferase involved in cell wall biosynthesis